MTIFLDNLPFIINEIKSIKESIITNIVLNGQIPSPTFKESNVSNFLLDRLAEFHVDECTFDGYRNPIGIIRGISETKPPIFIVTRLDTLSEKEPDFAHYIVKKNSIIGPGLIDSAVSTGVLLTLPQIFEKLNLHFESDIVLAGVIQSMGKGNLRGIRHLLKTWKGPIRGAICIEGTELGRLNYFSDGMHRCEVECNITPVNQTQYVYKPNAILILNEVINQILTLRLPQRPLSRIIIGKIKGGIKHGKIATNATLGFEIQSNSDNMVKAIFNDIKDIIESISNEYQVELKFKVISSLNAAKIKYNHPLVRSAAQILQKLNLKPMSKPCESELSIFLSKKIPAITLGITKGKDYNLEISKIEIEPMFKGIAQLIAAIKAIDSGVCDE